MITEQRADVKRASTRGCSIAAANRGACIPARRYSR
jgi:hypothetical protein